MTPDDEADVEAALRRTKQLMRDFEANYPFRAEASKLIDKLFTESRGPVDATRADRERARIGAELFVAYGRISELFDDTATVELTEYVFGRVAEVVQAAYELGIHAAPDGRHARAEHSDQCGAKARAVEAAVRIYLDAHPELTPPKATTEYASAIRPYIHDALSLPKNAKRPAISAIKQAIGAVKRRTAL